MAINAYIFATALSKMRLSLQSAECCSACCQVTLETELSSPDRSPILQPFSNKLAHSKCKLSTFMASHGHIDAQVCVNTHGRESGGCQCKGPTRQADIFTLYIFIIFHKIFLCFAALIHTFAVSSSNQNFVGYSGRYESLKFQV